MAFRDIVGNQRVKKILKRAIEKERLPNSLIFSGPEGVGKKSTAQVLAKAMNCVQAGLDACEKCLCCKAINKKNFPDVIEIEPERDNIKIEQMRMMKQIAFLKPMSGRKRFFIVNKAEKMKDEAANSLLKVLEEPPSFSHIILITHNPYLLLPTIKSRCQQLDFSPISQQDIEKILLEKGYPQKKAKIISLVVHGNMEQALSLDWDEIKEKRERVWKFFLPLLGKKEKINFLFSDFFNSSSLRREEIEQFLEIFASFCRDFLLIKESEEVKFLFNPDYAEEMKKRKDSLSVEQTLNLLVKIDFMFYSLDKNVNSNLLVSSFISNIIEQKYA